MQLDSSQLVPATARDALRRMATEAAALYCGVAKHTLDKWRGLGCGPKFSKLGRRVVYSVADLDAWLEARKHASTSEYEGSRSSTKGARHAA